MKPTTYAFAAATPLAASFVAVAAAIAFGGPKSPAPMASINSPFRSVDCCGLPSLSHYSGKDGASLAYRNYASEMSEPRGSVVLVHGSSASSSSMHVLARAFSASGCSAYALDVRGHGASGPKGTIGYLGQLEDDLEAFMQTETLSTPVTLVGFSAGGGFVLRYAGSARQEQFQNYLLLSPFLGQDAPTARPGSGGWVSVGVPRIVALSLLNHLGVHAFNDMPVARFALNAEAKTFLTRGYSYTMAANFRPPNHYESKIRAVREPVCVLAGVSDEAFYSDRFEGVFRKLGRQWLETLLPGIGHIPLTLAPGAVKAAVEAVDAMNLK